MARSNARANGKAKFDFTPIVDQVTGIFSKELADSIGELNEAVAFGEGQASFSCTLQIAKQKGGRFKATLKSRIRAPREPMVIDMHLNEAGQLELGFDPAVHGTKDDDGDGDSDEEHGEVVHLMKDGVVQ